MGRVFLVTLEAGYLDPYYVCSTCTKAHIALQEDQHHQFQDEDGNRVAVFSKVVNVTVDEPIHHYHVGLHTVADIYCVNCGDKLGFQYIQIGSRWVDNDKRIENGYLQIMTEKLSTRYGDYWDQ